MQFIAVFGEGLYDLWDFMISTTCLLFGIRLYRIGFEDGLGRMLISANVSISAVFSILFALAYIIEFTQVVVFQAGPGDYFAPARYLEAEAFGFLELGYNSTVTRGEVISILLIPVLWKFIRRSPS